MTQIAISLLGPAHITDGNDAIVDFKTSKNLALLAYLAIEAGRPHRRESLAGLLWPDFDSTAARNSLRQAIATLRRVLDDRDAEQPLFITTRDTVLFRQLAAVEVDVLRFDAEWEAIHSHRHRRLETCPICHNRLEVLIDLFRGEFLQGLSLDDAPEYEIWLTTHREHYRRRASRALYILAKNASRRGAYEAALIHARRQLQLDPLNEDAHLQMMSALAYSGRRDEAVAHFVELRKLLSESLGIEPGEELRQFHGRIRSDTLRSAPFDRRLAQTIPRTTQSLIGRQQDLGNHTRDRRFAV